MSYRDVPESDIVALAVVLVGSAAITQCVTVTVTVWLQRLA